MVFCCLLEHIRTGYIASMSNDQPSFMQPSTSKIGYVKPVTVPLPDWLNGTPKREEPKENKELLFRRFEGFFPTLLDRLCAGQTITQALEEFPLPIERGAFMRWVRADASRNSMYKDAKEVRTEHLTAKMLTLAERAGSGQIMDFEGAKLEVDIYKWLIPRENKKDYGDTKTIELNQNISIVAALQAGDNRIAQITQYTEDDEPQQQYKQITEAIDADWEEVDE